MAHAVDSGRRVYAPVPVVVLERLHLLLQRSVAGLFNARRAVVAWRRHRVCVTCGRSLAALLDLFYYPPPLPQKGAGRGCLHSTFDHHVLVNVASFAMLSFVDTASALT